MKIVTIGDGGTVRSVCLARLLKDGQVDGHQHDAIALSGMWNAQGTRDMLSVWADLVVVMMPHMREKYVSPPFHARTKVCDVGPDTYQN